MTVVLVSGGLTFVIGLLILRPLSKTGRLQARARTPDEGRQRELLRQLRDLDDDLAAGKLTQADHVRLRDPVEREAAAALEPANTAPPGLTSEVCEEGRRRLKSARRRVGRILLMLTATAASVTFLLINGVSSRTAGQAITGDSIPGVSSAAGRTSASAPASVAGRKSPTPAQLAAVTAAQAEVKQNPKDVDAHLALAAAYLAAGAGQLAAVEYLTVTRLDPANAEANTSLALLAFDVGHPARGKAMVDRVLAVNPKYPQALYVRGLINLIGLRRPGSAARDFSAYLAVAPFGSHRIDAVTLLALAVSQEHR